MTAFFTPRHWPRVYFFKLPPRYAIASVASLSSTILKSKLVTMGEKYSN